MEATKGCYLGWPEAIDWAVRYLDFWALASLEGKLPALWSEILIAPKQNCRTLPRSMVFGSGEGTRSVISHKGLLFRMARGNWLGCLVSYFWALARLWKANCQVREDRTSSDRNRIVELYHDPRCSAVVRGRDLLHEYAVSVPACFLYDSFACTVWCADASCLFFSSFFGRGSIPRNRAEELRACARSWPTQGHVLSGRDLNSKVRASLSADCRNRSHSDDNLILITETLPIDGHLMLRFNGGGRFQVRSGAVTVCSVLPLCPND